MFFNFPPKRLANTMMQRDVNWMLDQFRHVAVFCPATVAVANPAAPSFVVPGFYLTVTGMLAYVQTASTVGAATITVLKNAVVQNTITIAQDVKSSGLTDLVAAGATWELAPDDVLSVAITGAGVTTAGMTVKVVVRRHNA